MIFSDALSHIYKVSELEVASERRSVLINQMLENEKDGKDCMSCTGRCCTFEANSMQMTSIEALEAVSELEKRDLLNEETRKKLKDCIEEFRLDKYIQIGPGEFYRKTYTCPFFFYPSFGCGLGKSHKPYGCIAFNPCEGGQKDGGNCQSDLSIQEDRAELFEVNEDRAIQTLFKDYGISTLKESIPIKILEVWDKLAK